MTVKAPIRRRSKELSIESIDYLYADLVRLFYDEGKVAEARKVGKRLQRAIAKDLDESDSIRGEEIRSLLAELKGDFVEAIRSREAEIRKILELHTLAKNKSSWNYVFRLYDYGDVSDRLDLLALLYESAGEHDRAVAVLEESKRFCASHRMPFDGQDVLTEFEHARQARLKFVRNGGRKSKSTTKQIKRVTT